ncbi:INO80 complex subunit Ies4-domain-containing protein [Apodospora peruviana]|uniref:INO80 complex subunit Ies4-domain-containing protein n=1 Tax=Apodospora peruviana TaxID=516989 RepID=A0AAE0IIB5_9PEZI|nr:INO80 complex subunit Ies4-domain-containing protein [Apodospora peruviana]
MPPSSKNAAASKDRRKSNTATAAPVSSSPSKPTHIITLRTTPKQLRAIVDPDSVKEDSPPPKEVVDESPGTSATIPAAPNSNAENASDSSPNTPAAGTPAPQSATMGPPAEGPKKKGPKRSAMAAANGNGELKVRGKPGPKKKQRLEDGTVEPSSRGAGLSAHKLGPKANQGAINAGLRALDRSGKPCRKWTRGGFTLKSFTGVVWEIPRWTAPPKPQPELSQSSAAASDLENSNPVSEVEGGSGKENNGTNGLLMPNGVNEAHGAAAGGSSNQQVKSEVASNTNLETASLLMDIDVPTPSAGPPSVAAAGDSNAPTPVPIAAA